MDEYFRLAQTSPFCFLVATVGMYYGFKVLCENIAGCCDCDEDGWDNNDEEDK